ncbi:hypothetical protein C0389_07660 [bacterium]|nr:hypothetical protein [bacterium]
MPNTLTFILLFGALQGLLLAVTLFFKKQNQHANRTLAVAILCLSLDLLSVYSTMMGLYKENPSIFGATHAFPFIYGPIFYLYTKILSGNEKKFRLKYLIHLIPFVMAHLYVSPFYLLSHQEKLVRINQYLTEIQTDMLVIGILKPIHGLVYTALSLNLLEGFSKKIKRGFSNIDKINLDWLKYLIVSTTVVWIVVIISFMNFFITESAAIFDPIIYLSMSVLIYAIGYGALNQPEVFTQTEFIDETKAELELAKEKYEKSTLNETDIQKIKTELLKLMNSKKLFLNSELTLAQLSKELGVTNHNLSEVINTSFKKNYYDFINAYRVEEFKERVKNPEFLNYSLLAIAFESGFSSKSSFNSIFKKFTNQTPSEYIKQVS